MELIILIGLQGAGKSTFYKSYFSDTHLRLNQDMLKTKHRQKILFNACLESKTNTVIDKINVSKEDRAPLIKLAHKHKFKVIAYYFNVPIEEAIQRNNQRNGKAKIPEVGIKGALKKLQKPNFNEGFDRIFNVNILNNEFKLIEIDPNEI